MSVNWSIRQKLSFWASLSLIAVAGITLLAVRMVADSALKSTVRGYLISTVEQNAAQIEYVPEKQTDENSLFLSYGDAYLKIDLDFMDVVNDVFTALYDENGTMLYGENPLSKETAEIPFVEGIWRPLVIKDTRYELYDHCLLLETGIPLLWIRGIVSETDGLLQLQQITRGLLMFLPLLIALGINFVP